jgi:hypothetical protein
MVVSLRPSNPTRQILADIDREIEKTRDDCRSPVVAIVCPPVWYDTRDQAGAIDVKLFNTLYDIVTNRVLAYFWKFENYVILPADRQQYPEYEHGVLLPMSIYLLKGLPNGLVL